MKAIIVIAAIIAACKLGIDNGRQKAIIEHQSRPIAIYPVEDKPKLSIQIPKGE
jgi:hypothetical protein